MRLLVIALLVAGCARTPPPAVEVRTQVVTREVMRPCPVTIPKRPAPLARPLPSDAVALAAVLGIKLGEYSGAGAWADRAERALERCVAGE